MAPSARICKRLWNPGIDFASLCSLTGRFENRVVVPACHAENRSLVSIKDLHTRALESTLVSNKILQNFCVALSLIFNGYDPLYFYSTAVPFYYVLLRSFSENMYRACAMHVCACAK
jgi:hypothetical protein